MCSSQPSTCLTTLRATRATVFLRKKNSKGGTGAFSHPLKIRAVRGLGNPQGMADFWATSKSLRYAVEEQVHFVRFSLSMTARG